MEANAIISAPRFSGRQDNRWLQYVSPMEQMTFYEFMTTPSPGRDRYVRDFGRVEIDKQLVIITV